MKGPAKEAVLVERIEKIAEKGGDFELTVKFDGEALISLARTLEATPRDVAFLLAVCAKTFHLEERARA